MCTTYFYISTRVELLNFKAKRGTIAGENRKDLIIDPKVDHFYGLFVVF